MSDDPGVSEMILAIDPSYSGQAGFAYFDNGGLIEYGIISPKDYWAWKIREKFLAGISALVIENSFFGGNAKVHEKLVIARMLWEIPAKDLFEIPVHHASPQEWQMAFQRAWHFGRRSKKDMPTLTHYAMTRWELKEQPKGDAISAILIGTWWVDRERIEGG